MRLAVHFDRAREISAPPKPQIAANTRRPPRPPPVKCTPNTRSMMKIIRLSRASTAKFVTRNRKMRFMSLFFGQTNRNMVTRHTNGRDVPVQFQAAPRGPGDVWHADRDDRWADRLVCAGNIWD